MLHVHISSFGGSRRCRAAALLLTSISLGACSLEPDQTVPSDMYSTSSLVVPDPDDTSPIEPPPRNLVLHQITASSIRYSFRCGANATHHDVMRRSETGEEISVASLPICPGTFFLTDSSVQPFTSYCYWVIGSNSANAAASSENCATTPLDFDLPALPTATVTVTGPTVATLTLRDNATNESGFRVFLQTNGVGPFVPIQAIRRTQRADRSTGDRFTIEMSGLPAESVNLLRVEVFHDFAPALASRLVAFTTQSSGQIP
jgi:hypothetical protein